MSLPMLVAGTPTFTSPCMLGAVTRSVAPLMMAEPTKVSEESVATKDMVGVVIPTSQGTAPPPTAAARKVPTGENCCGLVLTV